MNWLPPDGALRGIALDHLLGWNLSIVFWLFVAAQVLLVAALVRRWMGRCSAREQRPKSRGSFLFLHVLPLLAIIGLYLWMLVSGHRLWAASARVAPCARASRWRSRGCSSTGIFGIRDAMAFTERRRPNLVSAPTGNPLGLDR